MLVVDTDFADWYILKNILEAGYRPRAIIVEVNAVISPAHYKVMEYPHPDGRTFWDGNTAEFGGSVAAFHWLGSLHHYSMVHCELTGVNCFLISDEVLGTSLSGVLSPSMVLRAPQYNPNTGNCGHQWKEGLHLVDVRKPAASTPPTINVKRCFPQRW